MKLGTKIFIFTWMAMILTLFVLTCPAIGILPVELVFLGIPMVAVCVGVVFVIEDY